MKIEKDFFLLQKDSLEELILGDVAIDVLAVICRELQNLKHVDVTSTLLTATDAQHFTLLKKLRSLRVSLHYGPAVSSFHMTLGSLNTQESIFVLT